MIVTNERFWSKVDIRTPDECWPWLAARRRTGYGKFGLHYRIVEAHRLAYELVVGLIPAGLVIDHLCRNPACVNPAHMEPVTLIENVLRGVGASAQNARKTHCKHGHPFDEENTYREPNRRGRHCRTCRREYAARYEATRPKRDWSTKR